MFKVLCSDTETGKLKKVVIFKRLSVFAFRVVSTKRVWFLGFFTDFGAPIVASICFSMTKGDNVVIVFS